jgi:hypothetical protein
MVEEKQWRNKFFEADGDTVRATQIGTLINVLKSCFLYSPDSVAPARVISSVEKVEPLPAEVESYNFALSLH